jgi:hypothetical protein
VSLFDIITRSPQVEHGGVVRIDQPHLEPITDDFQFARIGCSLEGDGVYERTDRSVLVFPASVNEPISVFGERFGIGKN